MLDLKADKPAKVKGNRRKKAREPRDWRQFFQRTLRLAVFCGGVALVVGISLLAGQLLFASGYFNVEEIRVENNGRVSVEAIVSRSDIQCGSCIFDLDLEMIGAKIEDDPWIAVASVERIFPRTVVIRVDERVPVAVANLDCLYYLDARGEIFKLLEEGDSLDFPVMTGIDRDLLLEHPEEGRQRLAEGMALLAEIAARKGFGLDDVSELHYDETEGFILYTYVGGVPIRIGYGNFDYKLDRLERVFADLAPRLPVLKYIDLNVMDRVIVKVDSHLAQSRG